MFDLDRFVADCLAAYQQEKSQKAVCEVLARAMADPNSVLKALGEPRRPEIRALYQSKELTITNLVWAPKMSVPPHDHTMWANIGLYTGREDNIFWRRTPGDPNAIEAAGARSLAASEATPLGANIIHSVLNPTNQLTAAIHIYGGDFFTAERSEWDSLTLEKHRFDGELARLRFEEANALYQATRSETKKPH